MPVAIRSATATGATNTSFTINYPSSMVSGEIILMWLVCKTGVTFNTPSGWTLIYQDDATVNAALFYRTWDSPNTTVTVTTSASTDIGYVTVTWNSGAVGKVLGFGNNGYSGSGTDPVDSGDTYAYTARGKSDKDTSGDNTLGVFQGGIMCPSDLPVYFYALKGASASAAPSIGGEDTSLASSTLPTTVTIRMGAIWSTYRAGARGFTVTNTPTSVAYGTWLSENADTGAGGGPGGNGTQNPLPLSISYTALDSRKNLRGYDAYSNVNPMSMVWQGNFYNNVTRAAYDSLWDKTHVRRGSGRVAISSAWRDYIQPGQGSSISVN